MTGKRLSYAIALVPLLASGFYVFVYLYRWEWNRALVAGMIFIVAEIGLVAALILERLRGLEKKMEVRVEDDELLDRIERSSQESTRAFEWLKDGQDNLNVFVPVLMGAGLVISALAWLVERLAAVTARPVLERRLAARMAPISVPRGVLTMGATTVTAPPRKRLSTLGPPAVAIVLVLVTYAGIDLLGDLTQNRPDAMIGGRTEIVLNVETKNGMVSDREATRSLWAACSSTTSSDLSRIDNVGSSLLLTVRPELGKYSFRRLKGCLEDATLDGIRADVRGDT